VVSVCQPQEAVPIQETEDDMDVDTIVPGSFVKHDVLSSPPISAAPTITSFQNLFYDTMSPRRSSDSPAGPLPKKRRSLSPDSVRSARLTAAHDVSSSPAPPSSPSQRKVERMSSGPLLPAFNKPSLQGLGGPPSTSNKRSRRPVLSAMVNPSDACLQSAYPVMSTGDQASQLHGLPPPRRAFSAMLLPTGPENFSDEGSSFDGPDMSSPAQAYAKRQQVKTIRRCDGTDDFRPLTGATAMVKRDMDESPSAKFLNAGMPGFGDNEALGKILPCHRVREDGLMRISPETVSNVTRYVVHS
jgi:M-phase inducer tyrosine phosphatase